MKINKINKYKYLKFLIFCLLILLFILLNMDNFIKAMNYNNISDSDTFKNDKNIYTKFMKVNNAKANIVVTHGIGESSEEYIKLAKILNEFDFSVFLYDFRSHGRSYNENNIANIQDYNVLLEDLNLIVQKIKQDNNLKIILLGHSLGGIINNCYIFKYNDIDGVINSGSPTKIINEVQIFMDKNQIQNISNIPTATEDQYEKFARIPLNEEEKKYRISCITPQFIKTTMVDSIQYFEKEFKDKQFYYPKSILLLHGQQDYIISCENSQEMFNKMNNQNKKIILYPEAYHNLFHDINYQQVIKDVLEWLGEETLKK
ncbi:prolyl oligopeptidase family protein [Candidatus Phytoplasma oryzae]|uniref:Prolyl oligopeptidase family protein n=2 Tax=Candidatus Phytoplasma oryzae TaxID=203274 RepID=A0A139JR51_9MOLU|nr:prolyl oligopeptidase family protein [Candidatus Phytoplasma oryzae]KXT29356.1 prolyl oligopeptidase family protein [Candidatus Phytoplasma oryzae]RAM57908.1 hypothetical protein DH96_01205 [Candidatus Phytoplasma oryzae]